MIKTDPKLIVGSQWVLSKKPEGAVSTVLCVTNLTIKPDLQEKFPPQVVTLTESGKILSHEIGAFLERRDYVGVDLFVAKHVQSILDGGDVPQEEEEDIDAVDVDNDPAFDAILGEVSDEYTEEETGNIPVFIPAEYDGLALDDHFLSYAEAPGPVVGTTTHIVRFSLDSTLNIDHVRGIFEDSQGAIANLTSVTIDSHVERIELLTFDYVGTFLEVDPEGNGSALVYLSTKEVLPAKVESVVVDAPLHEIPQLNTTSTLLVTPADAQEVTPLHVVTSS